VTDIAQPSVSVRANSNGSKMFATTFSFDETAHQEFLLRPRLE